MRTWLACLVPWLLTACAGSAPAPQAATARPAASPTAASPSSPEPATAPSATPASTTTPPATSASATSAPATAAPTTAASAPAARAGDDKWKARPVDAVCQAGLSAVAAGRLDDFRGLGRCGRVDAEHALGSSGAEPSRFEQLGEYRVYPHRGGSIFVWFLADDIRVLELLYPKLGRPIQTLLGTPEAKTHSGLSREWEQWIYASRGLTAHVKRGSSEVIALFAYRPTTVAAFLETDIARASKSESPIEELK